MKISHKYTWRNVNGPVAEAEFIQDIKKNKTKTTDRRLIASNRLEWYKVLVFTYDMYNIIIYIHFLFFIFLSNIFSNALVGTYLLIVYLKR